MLLSARLFSSADSVNSFVLTDTWEWMEGDSPTVYLQLIDLSVDRASDGYSHPGRRYISAPAATLQVTLQSVDSAKTIQKTATLAFPADDRSIWKVQFTAQDKIVGTRDMRLVLTEGAKVTNGLVRQAVSIHAQNNSY